MGDPEDLDDEGLHAAMAAGPRLLVPGPTPSNVRLALHPTLEDALSATCDGDEVLLPAGEHVASGLGRLRESIVITGWAGAQETIVLNRQGDQAAACIDAGAKALTMQGLTIRASGGSDGTIRVCRGSLTMKDCIIDCSGFEGVRVLGTASLALTRCSIFGAFTAGLQISPGARASLDTVTVARNGGGDGKGCRGGQGGIQIRVEFSTKAVHPRSHPPSPSGPQPCRGAATGNPGVASCASVVAGAGAAPSKPSAAPANPGAASGAGVAAAGGAATGTGGSCCGGLSPRSVGTSLLSPERKRPEGGRTIFGTAGPFSFTERCTPSSPAPSAAAQPAAASSAAARPAALGPPQAKPAPPGVVGAATAAAAHAPCALAGPVPVAHVPEDDPLKPAGLLSMIHSKVRTLSLTRTRTLTLPVTLPAGLLSMIHSKVRIRATGASTRA